MNDEEKLQGFDEQLKTLNKLVATHNKGLKLEFALILRNEDHSTVKEANDRLAKKIDKLRAKLHAEWVQSAKEVRREIIIANGQIEKAIRAIEKRVKIAENIVKAVGYIDRVVETASRLLSMIL